MEIMKIPAEMEYLDEVINMIEAYLEPFECSAKDLYQIQVSIEELFTNISSYAYEEEGGEVEVQWRVVKDACQTIVWITLIDSGRPYNPIEKTDPDFEISFEDREIGGLGIYMVKLFMDYMEYQYVDGKNQFTIGKII